MTRNLWRSAVSVMIATPLALGAAPLLHTVPVAQADTSCTWNWGIKQSFRSYIKGKIARGGWGASGIGFTGNETGNGAFVFKASSPQASGDTVTVPFQGTLNFKGHDGVLDMTMSDFKVTASGNQAKISVDYVSYELNRSNYSRGQRIQGDDEVIATIRLQEPVKSGAKKVNLAGSTSLTSGGVKLFTGFYNQGEALDPSSGTIALDGSCAGGGSAGGGSGSQRQLNSISGNFTGFNKEAMDILSETNDTMNGITTFMGNTQAFLDELESFRNRGNSNSGTGNSNSGGSPSGNFTSDSGASDSGTDFGTSGTGGAGAGASTAGGSGFGATSAGGTSSGGASGGSDASCQATGVTQATAQWGVKKSFQSYITGSIAQGKWQLSGVGYNNGRFQFSGNSGAVKDGAGSIRYGGSIQFHGHHGKLDLNIANLEITFNGKTGKLIADVRSSNMEGQKKNFGRTVIANLNFSSLNVGADSASGEASVSLSDVGSKAFAEFYEPGTQLDPLSFRASLGGNADCGDVAGGGASGGAGGGDITSASGGGVNDAAIEEALAGDSEQGYEDGSKKFKIKSANGPNGSTADDPATYLLLFIAALVIAGGSTSRLIMNNS